MLLIACILLLIITVILYHYDFETSVYFCIIATTLCFICTILLWIANATSTDRFIYDLKSEYTSALMAIEEDNDEIAKHCIDAYNRDLINAKTEVNSIWIGFMFSSEYRNYVNNLELIDLSILIEEE